MRFLCPKGFGLGLLAASAWLAITAAEAVAGDASLPAATIADAEVLALFSTTSDYETIDGNTIRGSDESRAGTR
jgi:hypothetical protein